MGVFRLKLPAKKKFPERFKQTLTHVLDGAEISNGDAPSCIRAAKKVLQQRILMGHSGWDSKCIPGTPQAMMM